MFLSLIPPLIKYLSVFPVVVYAVLISISWTVIWMNQSCRSFSVIKSLERSKTYDNKCKHLVGVIKWVFPDWAKPAGIALFAKITTKTCAIMLSLPVITSMATLQNLS